MLNDAIDQVERREIVVRVDKLEFAALLRLLIVNKRRVSMMTR